MAALVGSLACNWEDAKDLALETVLRLWRYAQRAPERNWGTLADLAERGKLWAYVRRTATNTWIEEVRRGESRRATLLALAAEHHESDPIAEALSRLRAEEVLIALTRLPDRNQQALVLQCVGGCSHEEIAHILGTTAEYSKRLCYIGRKKLRELLELDEPEATVPRGKSDGMRRIPVKRLPAAAAA